MGIVVRAGSITLMALTMSCGPDAEKRVCMGNDAVGPLVSGAAVLRLDLYDPSVHCDGNHVKSGVGPPMQSHAYLSGQAIRLEVAPGPYTLMLTTYADPAATIVLGTGCTEADLSAGSQICFDLGITAPLDGGADDAGAPSDGGPDLSGPVLIAQDDFHRPNQTFWGVASDGQPWTGQAETATVFSIDANRGSITNGGTTSYRGMLGAKVQDEEVQATALTSRFDGTNINFGVTVRVVDANNHYKAYLDGSTFWIQKMLSGTTFDVASTPFSANLGIPYTIRMQAVGNAISAKVWDASQGEPSGWMLSISDASLVADGQCGVRALVPSPAVVLYTGFVAYRY